jgi:hypothetical protein
MATDATGATYDKRERRLGIISPQKLETPLPLQYPHWKKI